MRNYLGEFEVEELFEIKDIGVTMPVLCRLNSGITVVAKYMQNPFGEQVLINELIGSCIADMFNINIPEYGICNLSKNVIINTNFNEDIDENNAGPCFFTVYHGNTVPISKRLISNLEDGEVEKLVLFDHIISNHDRHWGNLIITSSKHGELFVIDHSHIFGSDIRISSDSIWREMQEEVILSNSILADNKELYDLLFRYVGFDDKQLIKQSVEFKKSFSNAVMEKVLGMIPEIWIQGDKYDILKNIVVLINKKMSMIDDICEMIIRERRLL